MYALGIDIGTTSICGIVLDTDTGKVIDSHTENSNAFIAASNPWEKIQDTDKVISLARKIVDSLLSYPVSVIGVTGQMHGIVYVNREGRAVSPLYTWQDGRGNQPYQGTTYAQYLGSFAGYGNVTDFYNRENSIRPKEATGYCTIMDYLAMNLCGRNTPLMHSTNAASLGCYSLEENQFLYDVNVEVTTDYALVGTYRNIPVSVAIGDNQASVFSTLADENNLLVNVGTGSQISVVCDQIKTGDNIETRPYFDGKYLVVGAALCGGRAYSILKNFYQEILAAAGVEGVDVYHIMNRMLEKRSGEASSLKVDTRFAGTRKDPALTGSILQITEDNFTPSDMTYSFLEGMTQELFDMYCQMGEKRKDLVGSGNGIRRNPALIATAEKRFGGKLQVPAHTEEAAYGAALFGLVACGAYPDGKTVQKMIRYTE